MTDSPDNQISKPTLQNHQHPTIIPATFLAFLFAITLYTGGAWVTLLNSSAQEFRGILIVATTLLAAAGYALNALYTDRKFLNALGTLLMGAIGLTIYALIAAPGDLLFAFALRNLPTALIQSVLVLGTLAGGLFLYAFRCRKLAMYGQLEIVLGIAGAVFVANQLFLTAPPQITTAFAEIGALYVMVRGLDNFYKALGPGPRRTWWNKVFFGNTSDEKLG